MLAVRRPLSDPLRLEMAPLGVDSPLDEALLSEARTTGGSAAL